VVAGFKHGNAAIHSPLFLSARPSSPCVDPATLPRQTDAVAGDEFVQIGDDVVYADGRGRRLLAARHL
jgi:hypothetical protein